MLEHARSIDLPGLCSVGFFRDATA
jgi:hypothetical protein